MKYKIFYINLLNVYEKLHTAPMYVSSLFFFLFSLIVKAQWLHTRDFMN